MSEGLRFPIGHYVKPAQIDAEIRSNYIKDIERFPSVLKEAVLHLNNDQLNTAYRPDGWTIRQVVHHCADSHMNSFTRFKLALTESKPVIKPYFEERWAELEDSKNMPLEPSLQMLTGIHQRWTILLKSLSEEQLQMKFIHPEHGKEFTLEECIGVYAWHGNHHLAHITSLKIRRNWL